MVLRHGSALSKMLSMFIMTVMLGRYNVYDLCLQLSVQLNLMPICRHFGGKLKVLDKLRF